MKPYYEHAGITIYHGDCIEVLPHISADCLITDPPYGVNLGKHRGAKGKRARALSRGAYLSYDDTPANYMDLVVPAINLALSICDRGAVFALAPAAWALPAPAAIGGVYIPAAIGRSPWGFQNLAPVLLYGGAPDLNLGSKQTMLKGKGKSHIDLGHPCPKPLPWMLWIVSLVSRHAECVIDPFAGSGTTLVAAKELGRKAIGIEIEERYCEIAAQRLSQEVLF